MTRREREITDMEEIIQILEKGMVLHLGLCDKEQPYVVPMNYGYTYEDGTLTFYVHGAKTGYKYDIIKENPKVFLSIESDVIPFEGKIACQYGTSYSSVMAKGTAVLVEDVEEKKHGLSVIMRTQTKKAFTFEDNLTTIVQVVRIDVTEFSAKRRPLPASITGEEK